MTVITNDVIPGELVSELRKLKSVKSVTIQ
jgi:predicted regulator of amino acid metabolism with ACT domain